MGLMSFSVKAFIRVHLSTQLISMHGSMRDHAVKTLNVRAEIQSFKKSYREDSSAGNDARSCSIGDWAHAQAVIDAAPSQTVERIAS